MPVLLIIIFEGLIASDIKKMDLIPANIASYTLEYYLIKITSRSRIIYWIIIGMAFSGISLLPFIYVDVSIQARGYFQADIEKQIVYIPFQGKIIYTSIRNGKWVEKGDTLLVIDSESLKALQFSINQRITENNAAIRDLIILTGLDSFDLKKPDFDLVTKKYKAEYRNVLNQQNIQFQKFQKKVTEHERNELLYSQEIIPKSDFENSLFILGSERDNLNQVLLNQISVWQSDLTSRTNECIKLSAELEQCIEELSNRIVLAPTRGKILQSSDILLGSLVSPGQKIAEISPDGELVATCFVKPGEIGLINEAQKLRIQVDAYNYHEWGLLPGSIIDISDDMIIEDRSLAYFKIKCKPERQYLTLKNGTKAYIKKGMSFNARFVITRRSLYNLLFDKADKWFNPYTYNKKQVPDVS
ncbi:MAG: HlyD family efflux transporter periplasmic adaptor subunit [Bacteroidales bacterium]|nr:HlyD family efflux transporter periplasmic adaptor subunit [Bacteroidales bacterium]